MTGAWEIRAKAVQGHSTFLAEDIRISAVVDTLRQRAGLVKPQDGFPWVRQMFAAYRERLETELAGMAKAGLATAATKNPVHYSNESLCETFIQNTPEYARRAVQIKEELAMIPGRIQEFENYLFGLDVQAFDGQLADAEWTLKDWRLKRPEPFRDEFINTRPGYVLFETVGIVDGKPFDKFLTDELNRMGYKTKPIFYDAPDYEQKVLKYRELFLKEEEERARKKAEEKPAPQPVFPEQAGEYRDDSDRRQVGVGRLRRV